MHLSLSSSILYPYLITLWITVFKRVEKRGWGDESRAQKGDHLTNISIALTSIFDGSREKISL
jgi:hypothetical protein